MICLCKSWAKALVQKALRKRSNWKPGSGDTGSTSAWSQAMSILVRTTRDETWGNTVSRGVTTLGPNSDPCMLAYCWSTPLQMCRNALQANAGPALRYACSSTLGTHYRVRKAKMWAWGRGGEWMRTKHGGCRKWGGKEGPAEFSSWPDTRLCDSVLAALLLQNLESGAFLT